MTPAKLPSGQYLLIDVPEGPFTEIQITTAGLALFRDTKPIGTATVKPLPEGQWELIGKGDSVTEEQAAKVIECYIYSGRSSYIAYKDYSGKKPQSEDDILTTALSSLNSWIRSHGKEPGKIVIVKKK